MKKIILFFAVTLSAIAYSQESNTIEPDFIGEVIAIKGDNSTQLLEKNVVKIKTAANASIYIFGIGSVKSKFVINGCCSSVRLSKNDNIKFIIKAVDNNTDPMSIISIFQFETSKKDRKAELSSIGTFEGHSDNNLKYVSFNAKKYGESSYLITLNKRDAGEYGITIKNPNNLDQKSLIVSTFSLQ